MRRPRLQRILIDAVRASGAEVRLGTRASALDQDDDGVTVHFTDGTEHRYDLVIAADGLGSHPRRDRHHRPARTHRHGHLADRRPRPAGLDRTDLSYGGPAYIAGYCPTSDSTLYAYVVEANRDRASIPPESYADEMRRLASAYGGFWPEITAHITDAAEVNYTWFDRLLVEGPWHRGRVVLAGDAAHCCPPTLAQGAAMSLEDAFVLAELLTGTDTWDDALFQSYHQRRVLACGRSWRHPCRSVSGSWTGSATPTCPA
ncbi:FAD-dependent monooxygenase [Streptomyces sp. M19]